MIARHARRLLMRSRRRLVSGRDERGTLSVELAVLTPALIGCLLVIAGAARYVDAEDQVSSAAWASARAASLEPTAASAATAGRAAAVGALADRGRACARLEVTVNTGAFAPGGSVRATVTCNADLSDLAAFGLPSRTFTATAVVPIETHRVMP
jgi:Flp pilus assembly protein TadG